MNKRMVSIIFLVLGIVLIIVGLVLGTGKEEKKPEKEIFPTPEVEEGDKTIDKVMTKEKTAEEINSFNTKIFTDNVTKAELDKLVSSSVNYNDIFYGKDIYFRHINDEITGVDDINKKRDVYITALEKNIKDNFDYKLEEYVVSNDGAVVQNISVKTFYYKVFLFDYFELVNKITSYTKYANMEVTEETKLDDQDLKDIYTINIKALELMSLHFDDYVNKEEYVPLTLIYRLDNGVVTCDYFSYYMFLGGSTQLHSSLPDSNRTARIENIIKEAINSGDFDISNPLILK